MKQVPGLVSVIVAVYNGKDEIDATLESALTQTYAPLEIIVVDGASDDGTQEVVLKKEGRIAAFVSERDDGIGDAWNKGLAICKGEFVALLNCGDLWPEDFIAKHMSSLSMKPRTVQYCTTYMTQDRLVIGRADRDFCAARLSDGFGFLHTSVMTSKAVYEEVGHFSTAKRIAIDADWLLRALKAHVPFVRVESHNYMAVGGVSSRQWLRAQREYVASLSDLGFLPGGTRGLMWLKVLQSIYLRSGLPKMRQHVRMQTALLAVAAVNGVSRIFPFHSIRRLAWTVAGVDVHRRAVVHQGVRLMARRRLQIGDGCIVNRGVVLDNRCNIVIGCHVSIAHDCRIYTTGHDFESPDFAIKSRSVYVDDYAVLFAGAVLMPGVKIGAGAVVLPFSVVTKDVPALAVVGGVPATLRGHRNSAPKYRLDYRYWFAP